MPRGKRREPAEAGVATTEKPKRRMKPETLMRGIEQLDAEQIRTTRAAIEKQIDEVRKGVEAKVEKRVGRLRDKLSKLRVLERLVAAAGGDGQAEADAEAEQDAADDELARRVRSLLTVRGPSTLAVLCRELEVEPARVESAMARRKAMFLFDPMRRQWEVL